jgi:hypothetical protein
MSELEHVAVQASVGYAKISIKRRVLPYTQTLMQLGSINLQKTTVSIGF